MSRIVAVMSVVLTISFGPGGGRVAIAQDRTASRAEPRPTKNPLEGNALAISNGAAMFRNRLDLSRVGTRRTRRNPRSSFRLK